MNNRFSTILRHRILPVIAIHSAAHADALGDALIAGGLPVAEVTFRTDAAADAIKILSRKKELIVGAGTVLTTEQVRQAIDAGACFMVSPGFNPKVVGFCLERDVPVFPGVSNPTDIEMALEFGLDVVKFFPAEAFGGIKLLSAMSAPYPMVKFIPTGGIGPDNLLSYLRHPKVAACGGSWMVKSKLIADQCFDEITRLTGQALAIAENAGTY